MTAETTTALDEARPYLRVSADTSGRKRSVNEQDADLTMDAAEHGWPLGKPYCDNDTGASRYSTKARDGFADLMADIEAGRFTGILLLWESSRGSRRVSEWVRLLEACEAAGVRIWVHIAEMLYDPAIASHRKTLLTDAVDSEYETSKLSMRIRRSVAAGAAAGRPAGRAPFGYVREFDPTTREFVRQVEVPQEADLIREAFDRFHAGHSIRGIARDFAGRGVVGRGGSPIMPETLRVMLRHQAYAGRREHTPATGQPGVYAGMWDAIVDPVIFDAVQSKLDDPSRVTTRPGRGVHWLSMIATCGPCGGTLAAAQRPSPGVWKYVCRTKGCVKIDKADLDAYCAVVVLKWLSEPEAYERWAAVGTDPAALDLADAKLTAITVELDTLYRQVASGDASVAALTAIEPGLLARKAAAAKARADLLGPPGMDYWFNQGSNLLDQWEGAPVPARRELARNAFIPELLGQLVVNRTPAHRPAGRPVDPAERVEWRRA